MGIETILAWCLANAGWVISGISALVALFIPKEVKNKVAFSMGAKLSAFCSTRFGKAVWEGFEVILIGFVGNFINSFIAGLKSDNLDLKK